MLTLSLGCGLLLYVACALTFFRLGLFFFRPSGTPSQKLIAQLTLGISIWFWPILAPLICLVILDLIRKGWELEEA